jgi:hypothetical protein
MISITKLQRPAPASGEQGSAFLGHVPSTLLNDAANQRVVLFVFWEAFFRPIPP